MQHYPSPAAVEGIVAQMTWPWITELLVCILVTDLQEQQVLISK
jgi:hypothetical protein